MTLPTQAVLPLLQHPLPDWLRDAFAQPCESRYSEVAGCRIHHLVWGAHTNPGLLFVHGRMSHAYAWAMIAPLLAQRFRCVSMDLSGMGDSGWRETYPYDLRAQELIALATDGSLFSAPPIVVSHSYGAVVACKAWKQEPRHLSALVACEPSLTHPDLWQELTPRQEERGLKRPQRVRPTARELLERFRLAPPQTSEMPVLEEYVAANGARQTPEGWQWKFDPHVYSRHEEGHDDWWVNHTQEFLAVDVPKAIVHAERSDFATRETVDALAERATLGRAAIPEAAHHLMLDQPLALAAAVEGLASAYV